MISFITFIFNVGDPIFRAGRKIIIVRQVLNVLSEFFILWRTLINCDMH